MQIDLHIVPFRAVICGAIGVSKTVAVLLVAASTLAGKAHFSSVDRTGALEEGCVV